MLDLNKKINQWLVLIGLSLIWGTSYILIKKSLRTFEGAELASVRITIAFLLLLPLAIRNITKVKTRHAIPLLLVGILGNGLPAYLFAKAQTTVASSVAGVLNSTVPMFAMLIGFIVFKVRFIWKNVAGVAIGMTGAVWLVMVDGDGKTNFEWTGVAYVIAATLCYGSSVNIIKEVLREVEAPVITSFAFASIGIPAVGIMLYSGALTKLNCTEAFIDLGYVSLLALFGTALSVLYFNKLVKHTSAIFATTVTYLIPIVAVVWGLADGESFTLMHGAACAVILAGVYMVNLKPKKTSDFS